MNTAFLLLSTAWLAAGDPVVVNGPHGCPNGCCNSCAPAAPCCAPCCCDCCCQGPGLLQRLMLALHRPCCNDCGCGNCCCQGPGLIHRILLALPKPCCQPCGCHQPDCGCGAPAANLHAVPSAPTTVPAVSPEKIDAPKEIPSGDAKPKVSGIDPDMENAPLVGVEDGPSPF